MAARALIALSVLLALAWASVTATATLKADVLSRPAKRELSVWIAGRMVPAPETLASVHDNLTAARDIAPGDPAIRDLLGLVGLRKIDRHQGASESVTHFTSAVALRPTSPYSWANLAAARYQVGDTGRLFELAIRRATELGGNEAEIQRVIGFYGLAVWDEVGDETRQAIDRTVSAGVRRDPTEMLQIAQRRGRLSTACRHLAGLTRPPDQKWLQICQSTEAK